MNVNTWYISGPYTAYPEQAPKVFNAFYAYLMRKFKYTEQKLVENNAKIFIPTKEIPTNYDWQSSMIFCEKVFMENVVKALFVIVNSYTFSSAGLAREIKWAKDRGVPIVWVVAFGSESDNFDFTLLSEPESLIKGDLPVF